ncbi:hypothetical protein [Shewanella maritima]|uniref:hypothetical protein n=1 Tax=Shewanella maritima TaxID=2520507 RepID=UPI0037356B07
MQLKCAHCYQSFNATTIEQTRGKGLLTQVQCPHCDAWLSRHKWLTLGKLIGFYIALSMVIYGVFFGGKMMVVVPLLILSVAMFVASHMMDHLVVIEPGKDAEQLEAEKQANKGEGAEE